MGIFEAILLGALQGLTEFLPVSSSGHLVLAQEIMGISHEGDITFEVFVHFGTLLSVLYAFRKDIGAIVMATYRVLLHPRSFGHMYRNDEFFRLAIFILVGTVPAAVVGLRFEAQIASLFSDPKLVSVMLMITGFILFLTRFSNPKEGVRVGLGSSIIIGFAQAIAIIPGISRSGSTISAGIFTGVSREHAAEFSFLLAVPVILGATLLKVGELAASPPGMEKMLSLIAGTVVASIFGYGAIRLLLDLLRKRRFSWLAYYCFLAGVLGVLFVG